MVQRMMRHTSTPTSEPSSGQTAIELQRLVDQISTIVIGKREQIELCVICLLADGHLLIEDIPGVGKTTLAQALARSLGLSFSRVQFTADLMPSDLLGVSMFDRQTGGFEFQPGPVFAQVLLADEINRAGPRTQSALLEAMEERQVSAEGATRPLPTPFFVIATQNPTEQLGTHPLPESQLDRFALRVSLGYPAPQAERALLAGQDRRQLLQGLGCVLSDTQWQAAQQAVSQVHVSDALLDYLQALLQASRNGHWFAQGLSPRAGLSLLRLARARALLQGRPHVSPEDLQAVWVAAVAHRVTGRPGGEDTASAARALLASVAIP